MLDGDGATTFRRSVWATTIAVRLADSNQEDKWIEDKVSRSGQWCWLFSRCSFPGDDETRFEKTAACVDSTGFDLDLMPVDPDGEQAGLSAGLHGFQ